MFLVIASVSEASEGSSNFKVSFCACKKTEMKLAHDDMSQ